MGRTSTDCHYNGKYDLDMTLGGAAASFLELWRNDGDGEVAS